MKLLGSTVSWLLRVLIRRWFLLFTLFALYYYHVILDKDMLCSCSSLPLDCWVYLFAPGLVLFMVQLWVDLVFHRALALLCQGGYSVAPVLIWRVLEAGLVGLLWLLSVLLDGDWYLCCGRMTVMCKSSSVLPNQIRNESQVIGLVLVVVVALAVSILSCIPVGRCCPTEWPEAVLEEAGIVTSLQMRMAAREQLKAKMDQSEGNWRKWAGLEKELVANFKQVETPRVQDTVHVNPVPLRPLSRMGSETDWGRARPGQNQDQAMSRQWRN